MEEKSQQIKGNGTNADMNLEATIITADEISNTAVVTPTTTTVSTMSVSNLDNQYFFEDEVFRIDKKGRVKFGLVIETSDVYSGDEEDEYDDVLNLGEIRVAWFPEGKENVQSEKSVALADRTLMPGDVVRRLSAVGKDAQRGYCREINMCADVKVLGTKYVIKNVAAERLRVIANWQHDSAVCLDSWVGSTKDIEEKAILRSFAGSRIEISSSDFFYFKSYNSHRPHGIHNRSAIYPGNVVIGRLTTLDDVKLLTPDIPILTNLKGKPVKEKYIVEDVYTDSVWVHWQCKALSDEGNIQASVLQQPNACISGDELKRLKRLNLFEACMLQINDRNFLKYSQYDNVMKKSEWEDSIAVKYKLKLNEQQKEEDQNVAQNNSSSTVTPRLEKFKKRLSLLDSEKCGKAKKHLLKTDKPHHSSNKEKSQTNDGDNDNTTTITTAARKSKDVDSGWVTIDDDSDDEDKDKNAESDEDYPFCVEQLTENESTTPTISACSSAASSPKRTMRRQLKRKSKNFKKSAHNNVQAEFTPKEGDELITEALLVYSTATVVWQDGTIEKNIPSTQLYPIHHLDNHEFFLGDFVISAKEDCEVSFRDYGVVQAVDHNGRTARVKWFTTYTSANEPKPTYNGETEVSVYDLKDHPDFQYRPGTMVIRVANFTGADAACTAGQIIDNCIDGRVKVWWVDGHIGMCWPQDLFEVGQYCHADWGHDSDDSWETESENSEFGGESSPKLSLEESQILSNIERARVAVARLEEIFNISPNLQNSEVMRRLLSIYKGCRYLDRLLNTSFFHEDHFMGLIERVRKGGTQALSERTQDRKGRLFSYVQPSSQQQYHYQAIIAVNSAQKTSNTNANGLTKDYAPKVLFNISSTPFKCANSSISITANSAAAVNTSGTSTATPKRKNSSTLAVKNDNDNEKSVELPINLYSLLTSETAPNTSTTLTSLTPNNSPLRPEASTIKSDSYNVEKNQLLNSAMLNIEKAFEKTNQIKTNKTTTSSQDDSGNYSRNENCDCSYASSSDLTNTDANNSPLTKVNDDQNSISCSSIELIEDASPEQVCVRLCSLLKGQLVKCIDEIREKYYKNEDNMNLSTLFENNSIEDEAKSTTSIESNKNSKIDAANNTKECKNDNALPATITNDTTENDTSVLTTPTDSSVLTVPLECFQVLPVAPKTHKFHLTIFHPNNPQQYYRSVQREHRMLRSSLPTGVWVRVFEDRMDLLSVMIAGPSKTPYEDGMFFFDIQLGREYPKSPPLCHYISYCSDRMNPNLYEDGKVCVSLLGTWSGRESEVWGPNSTLLQVIVSIQGLILVPEPYFNEAGYEKQKGTQQGQENSRMYNEMVIIKMIQAMTKILQKPPDIFANEILHHFQLNGLSMYERIKGWMSLSKSLPITTEEAAANTEVTETKLMLNSDEPNEQLPEFPLLPASRGFCLTLEGLLNTFKLKLDKLTNFK